MLSAHFFGRRPALLIVMDGWGIGSGGSEDAIGRAHTPNFDRLWASRPHTTLMTHGHFVGLPAAKDLGGSEVGHLTMGAGQILDQGPTRINKAIADGSFFTSPALQEIVERGRLGGTLHLLGLLSDGNIHSHIDHFIALIDHADRSGIVNLRLHALLDGRDVAIQSAQIYVQRIEEHFAAINARGDRHYAFASGGGRELIVMDRDRDWSKVEIGWEMLVHGDCAHRFPDMLSAIDHFRLRKPGLVDQDMPPFLIVDETGEAIGRIVDGDALIMVNFRGDRAIEITEAFELAEFDGFDRGRRPDLLFAGMMVYDEDRDLPRLQLMGPTRVERPFGRRLVEMGIKQFRLTETQKYPHVTFFFNGGYREPLDANLEQYILIPSDRGVTFADKPQMKAAEIASEAERLIRTGGYGFGLINFANADMVGHCGAIEPAVAAIEAVDTALGRILAALDEVGGCALITADHGNAEEMEVAGKGGREPSTKHSTNPVPCILFDPRFDGSYALRQPVGKDVESAPGLANVAATLFVMLGMQPPADLAPSLLVER